MNNARRTRSVLAQLSATLAGGVLVTGAVAAKALDGANPILPGPESQVVDASVVLLQQVLKPQTSRSSIASALGIAGATLTPQTPVTLVATGDLSARAPFDVLVNDELAGNAVGLFPFSKTALAMGAFELADDAGTVTGGVTFTAELCAAKLTSGRTIVHVLCVLTTFTVQPLDGREPWSTIGAVTMLGEVTDPMLAAAFVKHVGRAIGDGAPADEALELGLAEAGATPLPTDCGAPCVAGLIGSRQGCSIAFGLQISAIFAHPLGTSSRGCLADCLSRGALNSACMGRCVSTFASQLAPLVLESLEALGECDLEAQTGYCECLEIWCGTPC